MDRHTARPRAALPVVFVCLCDEPQKTAARGRVVSQQGV